MASFSSAFELLQAARTAARELGSASVLQALLDLQGELLQLQVQTLEAQVENRELSNHLTRLRDNFSVQRKLERAADAYMLVESMDDRRGPYCAECWDTRDVLQLLLDAGEGTAYCPHCKSTVRARSAQPDRRGVPSTSTGSPSH
jgi:hypothetical protein